MDYSKYYTPPNIATLLVSKLNIDTPHSIVDICCGSCNLLHAASERWHDSKLYGVDITKTDVDDIIFTQLDGREFAKNHYSEFDLVLANPPFDYVEKRKEFPALFKDINFDYSTSRLEIEMLLANLTILSETGTLLIIMPSTFVEADCHWKLRKHLANMYYIKEIISLPDETFGVAKINSYAIIIKKENVKRKYTRYHSVIHAQGCYMFSKPKILKQKFIKDGIWEEYNIHVNEIPKLNSKRGNISSNLFKTDGIPILHTSKRREIWKPSIRYVSVIPENAIYVESGDIIVSRIGKSAGSWTVYLGKRIAISDCLYRIQDDKGKIAKKLEGKKYSLKLKGVATRYITMKDFNFWYASL